jgi:glutaminase
VVGDKVKHKNKSNDLQAAVNMIKTFVGLGILVMPSSYAKVEMSSMHHQFALAWLVAISDTLDSDRVDILLLYATTPGDRRRSE